MQVFSTQPIVQPGRACPEDVQGALRALAQVLEKNLRKTLDLLIVILPDRKSFLYGSVKRICETELGLVTQCCLSDNIKKCSPQFLANLALKINVKVGGRNTVLADAKLKRMPVVSDGPTIIFGADVTHPHPGEDSSPSIAAVVASQDWPEIATYAGLVSAQTHRQELIEDLYKVNSSQGLPSHGGMVRQLLLSFYKKTNQKPKRIIFYRDGVSEGQFLQVLDQEVPAIRSACSSIDRDFKPTITFVVVQKRHHTRLFPTDSGQTSMDTKSGNVLPGTVVDLAICHPTDFDFYLCSHAGIQGTSRPAHYHVLLDENKFSADQLQTFTNNLCYTYARCTKSVSIVPPAYYAHLLAFRARFYMDPEASVDGNISNDGRRAAALTGPRNTGVDGRGAVKPLPALKDNVKDVMFFC